MNVDYYALKKEYESIKNVALFSNHIISLFPLFQIIFYKSNEL